MHQELCRNAHKTSSAQTEPTQRSIPKIVVLPQLRLQIDSASPHGGYDGSHRSAQKRYRTQRKCHEIRPANASESKEEEEEEEEEGGIIENGQWRCVCINPQMVPATIYKMRPHTTMQERKTNSAY